MIPIPENGVYHGVEGAGEAAKVPGIDEINITAKEGQRFLKLPEGNSYLGFIFARGETAADVDTALRAAHRQLRFEIAPELNVVATHASD